MYNLSQEQNEKHSDSTCLLVILEHCDCMAAQVTGMLQDVLI